MQWISAIVAAVAAVTMARSIAVQLLRQAPLGLRRHLDNILPGAAAGLTLLSILIVTTFATLELILTAHRFGIGVLGLFVALNALDALRLMRSKDPTTVGKMAENIWARCLSVPPVFLISIVVTGMCLSGMRGRLTAWVMLLSALVGFIAIDGIVRYNNKAKLLYKASIDAEPVSKVGFAAFWWHALAFPLVVIIGSWQPGSAIGPTVAPIWHWLSIIGIGGLGAGAWATFAHFKSMRRAGGG
jgi:hypothetical protein